ncbi:hypothetical protein L3Y34_007607 [Caenorhabditis briggsae]|uniref:PDZ domain-containing protein n=1 Tax=Caenorhabditis briggsae TaxID=6238 RepID=A0AAE9A6X3_CAEBR|nr:hypothetical protein L3Y34_007607 [Caenorhabditis briggsae]
MTSFFCLPMGCQRQVDSLDRSQSNLQSIPSDIYRFRKLEDLNLSMNNIKDLGRLFTLRRLKVLDVSDNEISMLPAEIGQLTQLIELNLNRNEITDIPETLKNCKMLANLKLNGNPFTRLPESISECTSITILSLNETNLTALPSAMGSLANLRVLEARENHLRTIPSSIVDLKLLEELDLGQNEIEDLPAKLGKLSSLREFYVDMNSLTSLPDSISDCRMLDQLDVSENHIIRLPEKFGNMSGLTDLNISINEIIELPRSFGNLKRLQMLKAERNSLTQLTPEIGQCQALTEMYLGQNFLTDLPDSIGDLRNLTTLNVDCNNLSEIPETIGDCKALTVLSLRQNILTELPMTIGKCENMTVLDVASNKLTNLPFTVKVLYKLQALWLSENQTQSILKLTEGRDNKTGIKIVTCYLLPQADALEGDSRVGSALHQPDREGPTGGPKVHFHDQQDSTFEEERAAEVHLGNFERHNTPHPKTPKHKKGSIDGHMAPHDTDQPRQLSLTSNHRNSATSFGESSNSINRDLSDIRMPNGVRETTLSPEREDISPPRPQQPLATSNTSLISSSQHTIRIPRDDSGKLGLSFAGGTSNEPAPNSNGDSGLFVTKVTKGSAADRCGLREGDKLIRANDINMINASQGDAMQAIKKRETVELVVLRRSPSPVSRTSEPSLSGSAHELNHLDAGSPDSTLFATSSNTPVTASDVDQVIPVEIPDKDKNTRYKGTTRDFIVIEIDENEWRDKRSTRSSSIWTQDMFLLQKHHLLEFPMCQRSAVDCSFLSALNSFQAFGMQERPIVSDSIKFTEFLSGLTPSGTTTRISRFYRSSEEVQKQTKSASV